MQEATIVFKLLKLYADDNYMIRKVGEDGIKFENVEMGKFIGDYTPMVTLDVQAQLEKSEKQEAYTNAYQMIIADPTNNLTEAKRIMYPKMMPELSQEEIQAIITPAQQQMPAMAQPTPQMADMAAQDMMAQDVMQQEQLNAEPAL
jgi:hypothetical protein